MVKLFKVVLDRRSGKLGSSLEAPCLVTHAILLRMSFSSLNLGLWVLPWNCIEILVWFMDLITTPK